MRHLLIIFVSTIFFSNKGVANDIANGKKYISLNIKLDSGILINLLNSASLTSNGIFFESDREYDRATKSFTYYWNKLPRGKYEFKITTIFDKARSIAFKLSSDTTIVFPKIYDLIGCKNLHMDSLKKLDSIKIHFKTSGCFHDYGEQITLTKKDKESYRLVYRYDTTGYERMSNGLKRVLKIPVVNFKNVNSNIIGSLFQLIDASQSQQEKVLESGLGCVSTTSQHLYLLVGESVFQFYDGGICDWNLYDAFRRNFLSNFEN